MSAYVPAARGEDLLYQVLNEHLQTFLAARDEDGVRVPRYAREELEDYLACGMPEHGFALLRCDGCGTARAVAFSCKHRGFCPSCTGRRMNQGAAHLVDNVFPRAPVRQWVLSLPMPLRFRLAWDGELCRQVLATFLSEVFAHYRDATGLTAARGRAVTFEQTFGSSLNANLHFHALVLDGVYEADAAVFHPAPSPTTAEVQLVVDQVRERVEALLRARGLLDDEGEVADADDDDGQQMLLWTLNTNFHPDRESWPDRRAGRRRRRRARVRRGDRPPGAPDGGGAVEQRHQRRHRLRSGDRVHVHDRGVRLGEEQVPTDLREDVQRRHRLRQEAVAWTWQALCAVHAAHRQPPADPDDEAADGWEGLIAAAVRTGDEHAIKGALACVRGDRRRTDPRWRRVASRLTTA
jgi:hypothetical protein